MKLWLWYAPGSDAQVAAACAAAEKELKNRGTSISSAFQATAEANEMDSSYLGENTPHHQAVTAWYAAEFAAFSHLAESTGEWPVQAALIVIEDKR